MANLISYEFNSYAPQELGVFTYNIIEQMKDNPLFTDLKSEVDILKTKYDPFWAAYVTALKGGSDRTSERDARRADLLPQLFILAHLIESKAVNNPALVPASGFKARKQTKTASPEVSAPAQFTVKNVDKTGAVYGKWKGSDGSTSFTLQCRPKGDPIWGDGRHTTRQDMTIQGLEAGTIFEFRVCGHGYGESTSNWSAIVEVKVE